MYKVVSTTNINVYLCPSKFKNKEIRCKEITWLAQGHKMSKTKRIYKNVYSILITTSYPETTKSWKTP